MVVHAYNPGAGRLRQKNLSCSLANQTSLSFRFSERPCLKKKKRQKVIERQPSLDLCVSVYMYTIKSGIHSFFHASPITHKQIGCSRLKFSVCHATVNRKKVVPFLEMRNSKEEAGQREKLSITRICIKMYSYF